MAAPAGGQAPKKPKPKKRAKAKVDSPTLDQIKKAFAEAMPAQQSRNSWGMAKEQKETEKARGKARANTGTWQHYLASCSSLADVVTSLDWDPPRENLPKDVDLNTEVLLGTKKRKHSDNGRSPKRTLSQPLFPAEKYAGCGNEGGHANLAKIASKPTHTNRRMPQRTRMETLLRKGKERAKEKATTGQTGQR